MLVLDDEPVTRTLLRTVLDKYGRTIGDVTPREFVQHHQDRSQAAQASTALALL